MGHSPTANTKSIKTYAPPTSCAFRHIPEKINNFTIVTTAVHSGGRGEGGVGASWAADKLYILQFSAHMLENVWPKSEY